MSARVNVAYAAVFGSLGGSGVTAAAMTHHYWLLPSAIVLLLSVIPSWVLAKRDPS